MYLLLIQWLLRGLNKTPKFKSIDCKSNTGFSVIIAFRNEEDNLDSLLQSLLKIIYPKDLFEILLVNDASTDQSVVIIKNFIEKNKLINYRLIENNRKTISPKKDAINTAISSSRFEWIVTTDADCEVPANWLQSFNCFIFKKRVVFIAAPVLYREKESLIHQFQYLDWLSLVGTTIGSFGQNKPLMCSGANLAYSRKVFDQVGGFKGNEHIASGDDVFLMEKIRKVYPNKSLFLNSLFSCVYTQSLSNWKDLLQQRRRWAMKTGSLSNRFVKFVGILVLAINMLLVVIPIFFIFNKIEFISVLVVFLMKGVIDLFFLLKTAKIVNQKVNFLYWILSSLLYPFFIINVVVLGLLGQFNWKGRVFSK
jgi:glycosyltransferase involved in cell wall biosynthesis